MPPRKLLGESWLIIDLKLVWNFSIYLWYDRVRQHHIWENVRTGKRVLEFLVTRVEVQQTSQGVNLTTLSDCSSTGSTGEGILSLRLFLNHQWWPSSNIMESQWRRTVHFFKQHQGEAVAAAAWWSVIAIRSGNKHRQRADESPSQKMKAAFSEYFVKLFFFVNSVVYLLLAYKWNK